MNYYYHLTLTLVVLISSLSCSSQKDIIIESDYSYSGRFNKYKTYDFLIMQDNDNEDHKTVIEKNIMTKMESQGYRLTKEKPDLLISYKVFNDDFDIKGYSQPDFDTWVVNNWSDIWLAKDDNFNIGNPNISAEYNDQKYYMTGGTLHISFFDRKRRQTVWQGYASNVFPPNDESTERSVKIATNKIFRQFRIISNGYVSKR